jgi:prepilin-type N-terminal cleavage/methylation domain-containing protein
VAKETTVESDIKTVMTTAQALRSAQFATADDRTGIKGARRNADDRTDPGTLDATARRNPERSVEARTALSVSTRAAAKRITMSIRSGQTAVESADDIGNWKRGTQGIAQPPADAPCRNSRELRGLCAPGFTLIEIVVSLTILAVVAAIAIPTLKGLDAGEKSARADARARRPRAADRASGAMREGRSYQLSSSAKAFMPAAHCSHSRLATSS